MATQEIVIPGVLLATLAALSMVQAYSNMRQADQAKVAAPDASGHDVRFASPD